MSDVINNTLIETFGQSVGQALENVGTYFATQAVMLQSQAATTAQRAEFSKSMWLYLDELGTKLVGELEQIKTTTQLDSQIVARVNAMQQALSQAEAFASTATQAANIGQTLTTLGANAAAIVAAIEFT